MKFEEFKNLFMEDVKQFYFERSGRDVVVTTETIHKLNESYDSMVVKPVDSNIGLNLNMNQYFVAYENGVSYAEVIRKAVDSLVEYMDKSPEIDTSMLSNYEVMKEKIVLEVVSAERNAEMLLKVPHQMMEDMAVVYRFELSSDATGRGTILITNDLLERMGVTPEQLHEDAMSIVPEYKPVIIQGMSEVLAEMMGVEGEFLLTPEDMPGDEKMFVATVPDKIHGAGVIAYPDFMEQAKEKLGCDFFVLPSSLHEVILVKDDGSADYRELQEIVKTINAEQVSPEEQLTDSVYHYDSEDKVFELAEKFDDRAKERDAVSAEKSGKESVLKGLKDKQNIVDKAISSMDTSVRTPKLKEGVVI